MTGMGYPSTGTRMHAAVVAAWVSCLPQLRCFGSPAYPDPRGTYGQVAARSRSRGFFGGLVLAVPGLVYVQHVVGPTWPKTCRSAPNGWAAGRRGPQCYERPARDMSPVSARAANLEVPERPSRGGAAQVRMS